MKQAKFLLKEQVFKKIPIGMYNIKQNEDNDKHVHLEQHRIRKNLARAAYNASVVFSSLVVSINSLMFGLSLTIIKCAYKAFVKPEEVFGAAKYPLVTEEQFGTVYSIIMLGAFLTSFVIPFMSYRRKTSLVVNGVFNFSGCMILFLAYNFYTIVTSRIISGFGLGFTAAFVPIYLGEIAPLRFKGLFSAFHQVFLATGILLGSFLCYALDESIKWKYSISLAVIISGIAAVLLFFIRDTKVVSKVQNRTLANLFRNPLARRSIRTGIILHVSQQLSLINPVILFSEKILKVNNEVENFKTLMVGVTILFSSILCMTFVDRFGRKKLLIASMFTDSVALLGLMHKKTVVLSVYLFLLGFAAGLGPIVGFITGEIFPKEYKLAGTTFLLALNWGMSFLTSYIFPKCSELQQKLLFGTGSAVLMLGIVYVCFQFRETKGRESDFQ